MKRNSGRSNLLRRIEELESRAMGGSGLAQHSSTWMEFWQRQVHLYDAGRSHVPLTRQSVRLKMPAIQDRNAGSDFEKTRAA
jgi:hypothetical protein